jgi:hypothetical protein
MALFESRRENARQLIGPFIVFILGRGAFIAADYWGVKALLAPANPVGFAVGMVLLPAAALAAVMVLGSVAVGLMFMWQRR